MKVLFVAKQKNHKARIFSLSNPQFSSESQQKNNKTKTGSQFVFKEYWVGVRNESKPCKHKLARIGNVLLRSQKMDS
jgi:hypothetical protein